MARYAVISHHGIKGQKWGIRRYQNADGSLTSEGKSRYGNAKSFDDIRKVSKSIYKNRVSDFKRKHPDATLKEKARFKKDLNKGIKDFENRFIAKNYKRFRPSKDNVENTVLDTLGIIGGLATDVGGIFATTPVGLGVMAAGLAASTLTLGAKAADGALDKIKNKRIDKALELYGTDKDRRT